MKPDTLFSDVDLLCLKVDQLALHFIDRRLIETGVGVQNALSGTQRDFVLLQTYCQSTASASTGLTPYFPR